MVFKVREIETFLLIKGEDYEIIFFKRHFSDLFNFTSLAVRLINDKGKDVLLHKWSKTSYLVLVAL